MVLWFGRLLVIAHLALASPAVSNLNNASVRTVNATLGKDDAVILHKIVVFAVTMTTLSIVLFAAKFGVQRRYSCDSSVAGRLFLSVASICATSTAWYTLSVSFGLLNKYIFMRSDFAFPLIITTCHMFFKGLLVGVLRCGSRRCGGLPSVAWQVPTRREFFTYFVPIGLFTGADIGLTNFAIQVGQISMVTVIKNSGIILTLGMGILFGFQPCHRQLLLCVSLIFMGAVLALWNEPQFDLYGAIAAFFGCVCGSLRWTITQNVLQTTKYNPANIVLFISPSATLSIGVAAYYFEGERLHAVFRSKGLGTSTDTEYIWNFFFIALGGGGAALLLLIVEFVLVKKTSALTTDVIAKIKDILLIGMAIFLYHEQLRLINICGVFVMFIGILMFSWFKVQSGPGEEMPPVAYERVGIEVDDSVIFSSGDESDSSGVEEQDAYQNDQGLELTVKRNRAE